ncbi:MAG: T9SS type A sorting domain-containing protein [Bacteroidota bacterium]
MQKEIIRRLQTILLSSILFSLPFVAFAQSVSQANWNDYLGSYGNIPAWASWVRSYANTERLVGMSLLDTNHQILPNMLDSLENTMSRVPTNIDIMTTEGGLGSARDTARVNAYMRFIESDQAQTWKEVVRQQSVRLALLPNGSSRIYWQIGNEISSQSYSKTLRLWNGQDPNKVGDGQPYDMFIIPLYVEYLLAPTVEAIDSASVAVLGARGRIKICLGSITNAHNPNARVWGDSLLNYQIAGTFAPSIAGKRVYELVHLITLHYVMGVAPTSSWQTIMDGFKTWVGRGSITGIWSTEEVGIRAATRGAGAVVGSLVTARYLNWCITNNLSPLQVRTNYYGWNQGPSGTRVDEANQTVYDFLGPTRLALVEAAQVIYDFPNLESHAFLSENKSKGVIFTFLERGSVDTGYVSLLTLPKKAWGNISSATAHVFTTSGHQVVPLALTTTGDSFRLQPATTIPLGREVAIIIHIATSPLTTVNEGGVQLLHSFALEQNYPNPFNPTTTIRFSLPQSGHVTLKVYDILGREVAILVDEYKRPGRYSSTFYTLRSTLPSGVYFYQLTAGNFYQVRKAILIR